MATTLLVVKLFVCRVGHLPFQQGCQRLFQHSLCAACRHDLGSINRYGHGWGVPGSVQVSAVQLLIPVILNLAGAPVAAISGFIHTIGLAGLDKGVPGRGPAHTPWGSRMGYGRCVDCEQVNEHYTGQPTAFG